MGRARYFRYGEKEISYLKSKDKKLAAVIDAVGPIRRALDTDLFSAVVRHIVGQQISNKALAAVWGRLSEGLRTVDAATVLAAGEERLHGFGMSFRKAAYIMEFARKVEAGEFRLGALKKLGDEDAVAALTALSGIGVWTAEMILLFSLERPDVLSFGDFAIRRGLRMVYRHRDISREQFERYRHRFSPYGSVASLYLWAVAGGALPGATDPAERKRGGRT
ncbi:MAG: DNA-3-methyladenine glycosylase 2 family protein [Schwartzia sp.]|nr:DNA-3-methyladenine glycosylase 2 family protein [Schwartzia sp. (in: firmicutes)]MBR1885189.1 DNA-3-methyladenine glycosylase 2 family protein [Schwartzia sp. (in: firmicutes)]